MNPVGMLTEVLCTSARLDDSASRDDYGPSVLWFIKNRALRTWCGHRQIRLPHQISKSLKRLVGAPGLEPGTR